MELTETNVNRQIIVKMPCKLRCFKRWILFTVGVVLLNTHKMAEALQVTSTPGDQIVIAGYNDSHIELKWNINLQTKPYDRTRIFSSPDSGFSSSTLLYYNSGNPKIPAQFQNRMNVTIVVDRGAVTVTLVIRNVTLNDEMYYKVQVEETGGTQATDILVLIVYVRPSVQIYKERESFFENKTITLHCNATGKPAPTISWILVNNPSRSFPDGSSLTITSANESDAGQYKCIATNNAGTDIASINVTVIPFRIPSVDFVSRNQTVIEGRTIVLYCNASGYPTPTISWTQKENSLVISTGNILTLSQVTRDDTGLYICTAANHMGKDLEVVFVDVQFAPEIPRPPQSMIVNESDSKSLYCNASSNPPATITWTKEGDTNFRKTGEILLLINVTNNDAGSYICTAFNGIGQNTTTSSTVTVQYKPRGTVIQSNVTNNLVEQPEGIKLTCTSDAVPLPHVYEFYVNNNKHGESSNGVLELSSVSLPSLITIKCIPHNRYWTGEEAELNITVQDSCYTNPCMNGGFCRAVDKGNYTCDCLIGWTGANCTSKIDTEPEKAIGLITALATLGGLLFIALICVLIYIWWKFYKKGSPNPANQQDKSSSSVIKNSAEPSTAEEQRISEDNNNQELPSPKQRAKFHPFKTKVKPAESFDNVTCSSDHSQPSPS